MRAPGHRQGRHGAAALAIAVTLCVGAVSHAFGQVAFPDLVIQDVDWTSGMRFFSVTQPIVSPGDGNPQTETTEAAHTEFISGTEIHLTPGFHAGDLTGDGRFRAWINWGMGDANDVAIITPDPDTHVIDDVLHVNKWEKLEIGVVPAQSYREAIGRFFDHYYPDAPQDYFSDPGNVDEVHDLNPYADDSLQLVLTLTDPSGDPRMKWGFYMTEAEWSFPNDMTNPANLLIDDVSGPLHSHNIRFRFAPDEEGLWQFSISVKAPNSQNLANEPLEQVYYNGYSFVCDPPLEDNKGYLSVNPNNRRTLWFDATQEPFFGLGTNMPGPSGHPGVILFNNLDFMRQTMENLHSVGGNYARIFMGRGVFGTEWQNLGVYDHYWATQCYPPFNPQPPEYPEHRGNCQNQSWAFDKVMDQARANGIYVQLCVDPYPPIIDYESTNWHSHPYKIHYLDPGRVPGTVYDMKKFFYKDWSPTNPTNTTEGVFYYWKRKYKYIMARWGYSVNIAAIEPFNEIDQMLTYTSRNLTPVQGGEQFYAICPENKIDWPEDPDLKQVIKDWVTDIADYVRGTVTPSDPVASPLGEDNKLFLLSYARNEPNATSHYLPSTSPAVDLLDAHGLNEQINERIVGYEQSLAYRDNFQNGNLEKPFHHGEYSGAATVEYEPDEDLASNQIFANYDVSFHNEIWASTFFGNFTTGLSWNWNRVYWLADQLPVPPSDPGNPIPQPPFSNDIPHTHILNIGTPSQPIGVPVDNRKVHHHFKPLSDFLSTVQGLGFFSGEYTPHYYVHDPFENDFECYYLKNDESDMAVGWVHNMNAYWQNSYYVTNSAQNFLGCTVPASNPPSIPLYGFDADNYYYVTWFPTRMNTEVRPADYGIPGSWGSVDLMFQTEDFNGISANYLDTLRTDYAFIISPFEIKSLPLAVMPDSTNLAWDFTMYPNPTRTELFLRLSADGIMDVALYDLSGRQIQTWGGTSGPVLRLPIDQLAKGAYWVRVSHGTASRTKKLIVH